MGYRKLGLSHCGLRPAISLVCNLSSLICSLFFLFKKSKYFFNKLMESIYSLSFLCSCAHQRKESERQRKERGLALCRILRRALNSSQCSRTTRFRSDKCFALPFIKCTWKSFVYSAFPVHLVRDGTERST